MAYTYGNPATTDSALDVVMSVFEDMKQGALKVRLPDILWTQCIDLGNVDGSVPMGAEVVSKRVRDEAGMGAFISAVGANIPTVSMSQGKIKIPVETGAIMTHIDDEDVEKISYGYGESVQTEHVGIMRRGSERHIERTFFYGNPRVGFFGWLNFPGVPVLPAAGNVDALTGEQNVEMFSELYTSVLNQTKQVWKPDTLALPYSQYNFLATQVFNSANGSNVFTLDMVQKALDKLAGKPVLIQPIRHLEGAGAAGVDRAKLYTRMDSENQYMPYPQRFMLKSPQERGLGVDVFGKYRFGSYYELNPLSGAYLDGI